MRKKKLLAEMSVVIEKNNKLFERCQELEKSLNEKSNQVDELTASIAVVLAENNLLKAELQTKAQVVETNNDVKPSYNAPASPIILNNDYDADISREEQASNDSVVLDASIEPVECTTSFIAEEKIKLASKAIGRVVLECTKLCNDFAALGDVNSKDLINLALGRTEVFKSEVLQLATEKRCADDIVNELESKEQAVAEYFELLKNQT